MRLSPEYAFGEKGSETFDIPPNATVTYEVSLLEFEREADSWKLNAEESLEQAKLVKEKATGFLKKEKYELAIKLYEKANSYLSNCTCKLSTLKNFHVIIKCHFCNFSRHFLNVKCKIFSSASKGGEQNEEPQKVKTAVFSNIALCQLKLKNHLEVKKAVSEMTLFF